MSAVERVRELVTPLIDREGAELYDIEHGSGVLRIVVDKIGGINVDVIGTLSQDISAALDHDDPIPDSHYLLEVTSPGIERRLRLPPHFAGYIGEDIAIKVRRGVEGERRFDAHLVACDEAGIEVTLQAKDGQETRTLSYDDIEMARLIYRWADEKQPKQPKPAKEKTKSSKKASSKISTTQ